ncbi:alpha/beta fold hydrolase [Williamsia maris]|uniref:Pimeloyl-ACP methyl ester carboxylesterase n=1 Tax=Williamsia maris TaxID=72806 RepID=A0ABT1HJB2_9NOCA|nr:Pimeloyl-ACP methyl ester carboxylesterase [Williamsia maris]
MTRHTTADTTDRIGCTRRGSLELPIVDQGPLAGPPVVLLHGWPQDHRCWAPTARCLNAAGFRTYTPTLRGVTATAQPRWRWDYRLSVLVDDIAHIIDAIDRGPVHLVGHDLGGTVGWATATGHPDLLQSFTSVSSPHPAALYRDVISNPRHVAALVHMALFQLPVFPEHLLADPVRVENLLRRGGQKYPHANRDAARLLQSAMRTGGLNWYRGLALSGPGWRATTHVPVLEIRGQKDPFVASAAYQYSRRHARGTYTSLTIPGVNHWIPDLAPDRLASPIITHLRRATL